MSALRWILGGRPMHEITDEPSYAPFTDVVVGRRVRYWRDRYGRIWMAFSRWSQFRVRVGHTGEKP